MDGSVRWWASVLLNLQFMLPGLVCLLNQAHASLKCECCDRCSKHRGVEQSAKNVDIYVLVSHIISGVTSWT
jgi:hypothetical protein